MDSSKVRGGRLARRAKSFKEDFLGKLNQMRSPSGTRAGSPGKGSKNKMKLTEADLFEEKVTSSGSGKDIDSIVHSSRLLTSALRYFQDVVQKKKLEMLPGSATVVLETVVMIHSTLRKALVDEQSTLVLSATNQVYQSLANLIRWSDMILLHGDQALEKDVSHVVQSVQDAIKTLVQLSLDKLQNKDIKTPTNSNNQNGVHTTSKPESPHRNSLPDIPLTPREREILEQTQFPGFQTSQPIIHHSASSDSILGTGTHANTESTLPPPKPPLPQFREVSVRHSSAGSPTLSKEFLLDCAPPLPPKKKPGFVMQQLTDQVSFASSDTVLCNQSYGTSNTEIICSHFLERTSPFSQSPENSTPLSKSSASSLDSNLNYSADDLSVGQQKHLYLSHACFDTSFKQNVFSNSSQTFSCELVTCTSKSESKTTSHTEEVEDLTDNVGSVLKKITSSETLVTKTVSNSINLPPALPVKLRTTKSRALSQYDNVPQLFVSGSEDHLQRSDSDADKNSQCIQTHDHRCWLTSDHAPSCPHHKIPGRNEIGKPPPLPPKKKTIMAYMQMFGSYSQPSETEFLRHSLHTYNIIQANWQQMELSFFQQHSFSSSFISGSEDSISSDGPSRHNSMEKNMDDKFTTVTTPPALPPKKSRVNSLNISQFQPSVSPPSLCEKLSSPTLSETEGRNMNVSDNESSMQLEVDDLGALEELDATHYIVCKKPGEEGPDIRGGTVDSLIVQATKASKNDFLYQEAFLTTYRTFITPSDLVKKLLYRYTKFIHLSDMRQRAARNAFALLVRVVDDMCIADIQEDILKVLMDFIFQLVSRGELMLARALRKKVVEKCEARQKSLMTMPVLLPSMAITTHQASLLDFKSESLAEQMTLLDADLFQMIEIPEVLLWAKEQKEELSPNLTKFTEHFNKMSYWARSRILDQEEAKDRERYVVKFIKIMKYLRKLNNFNSYLAILSALDSAPIRRLEWQRNITEGLKEYCALIDSSSSFRAYRQALAETCPPCIPYIGLILQDLTFVHIGNSDWLSEGNVNFSKRWQQFNILDNMRRFKNCQYPFRRNDQIIAFFNNFDDYLCEEAMWQISETIKPRGGKKKSCDQL